MEKTAKLREACVGCGNCREVCPSYGCGGCDPVSLMAGDYSGIHACIGCGLCSRACKHTDPHYVVMEMLREAKGLHVPDSYRSCGMVIEPSEESKTVPSPKFDGSDVRLMPGCVVKCRVPFLENATVSAIKTIGLGCGELEGCCLYPAAFREMNDEERDSRRRELAGPVDGTPIVTLCTGCTMEMVSSGIDALHISEFLLQHVESLKSLPRLHAKVAVQPGCTSGKIESAMFGVVRALGCTVVNEDFGCCGKSTKGVSEKLMLQRQKECEGADVVVVACPTCFRKYDSFDGGIPVVHIGELVAIAAGDTSSLCYHKISIPKLERKIP